MTEKQGRESGDGGAERSVAAKMTSVNGKYVDVIRKAVQTIAR